MKKKMGDFTIREICNICKMEKGCNKCPFYSYDLACGGLANIEENELNRETEIDKKEKESFDYDVIYAYDIEELKGAVDKKLKEDWICQGGVMGMPYEGFRLQHSEKIEYNIVYYQAMIKKNAN